MERDEGAYGLGWDVEAEGGGVAGVVEKPKEEVEGDGATWL